MLFKFKSQAASDLIMLEADARRLLQIMLGEEPMQGIVQVQDLPGVMAKLEAAVVQDEVLRQARAQKMAMVQDDSSEEDEPRLDPVRLAQRATPMLRLLQRSLAEKVDVVWGV